MVKNRNNRSYTRRTRHKWNIETRKTEADIASEILKVDTRENLKMADGFLKITKYSNEK